MTIGYKIFGCRLNQAEGADLITQFEEAGFTRVPLGTETVDVTLVYSCTVTQKAEQECVKTLRQLRAAHPKTLLVLAGCAAETCDREALKDVVDLFVGQESKEKLVGVVAAHKGMVSKPSVPHVPRPATQRATLKVQDGCGFRCAYCIVPHVRGTPRSRAMAACLAEAKAFLDAGFQELVITGCNTACYEDQGRNLIALLQALLALPGLGRIRLGSIEPGTIEREIIELMAEDPRLCPFLHLPIQSGSDGVLQGMRRRYTLATIRETLEGAVRRLPRVSLGTDIITGFPGESLADFEATCQLIQAYPFSHVHVFPYSERPGTPAAAMQDKVPVSERKRRGRVLMHLAEQQREAYMKQFLGRQVTLLVEHFDRQGRACGWSAEHLPCAVYGLSASHRRMLQAFKVNAVAEGKLQGEI